MALHAKICGLSTKSTILEAIKSGADYVGFVFYAPSPRNITPEQAKKLASLVTKEVKKVGVFVNPTDQLLTSVLTQVDLDIIQLHGNETIERVQEIKKKFSKKIMKAISVVSVDDIKRAKQYENIVDLLLFDAKAPDDLEDALPGGNGIQFDWQLIANEKWAIPWMLSGGLDATNVMKAVKISGAQYVDISSGVETSPGNKDIKKIRAFLAAFLDSE